MPLTAERTNDKETGEHDWLAHMEKATFLFQDKTYSYYLCNLIGLKLLRLCIANKFNKTKIHVNI
jgi:hypothetical protein